MQIQAKDKRSRDRFRPTSMSCNLGQVVDLSTTGLRVMSRRQLRGEQVIVLTDTNKQPIRLRAKVLWHRRHTASEHVHGMRFDRVTFRQRDQLEDLVLALAAGHALPSPSAINRFGLMGTTLIVGALLMTFAAAVWSLLNPQIESAAPGIHEALHGIPELGALLVIAAGGCGLLGLTQRWAKTTYSRRETPSVSNRIAPQAELDRVRRSQSVLNCILESSLGGVCVLETIRGDRDAINGFQIQLVNPAGEQLIGKREDQLVGQMLQDALPGLVNHELYKDLYQIVRDGQAIQKQYQVGNDDKWYLVAMVRLVDGIAVTFMDTTESQQHREKLQHIAYHDELTGLPNRKALLEQVDTAISRTRRSPGHRCALLFLDFDRFKQVNDTLGHDAGDQLLCGIAKRLNENLRESDAVTTTGASECMPARLGGDEFVVLLDGIKSTDDAVAVAQRLLTVFKQPHLIADQEIVSTASIGIAISEGEYDNADDILRDSDSAMYQAKQSGKGRYVLFDQDMQNTIIKRIRMEQDLRQAIDNNELSLVYEPIIDLQTGMPAGFEALIRWHHPEQGMVSPATFIPMAENINLIGAIGEWVITQACAQLADWRKQGLAGRFLNINLSRGQLYEPNLVDLFREHIELHQLDPTDLRLELTETMVMNDLDFMAEKLNKLKALGLGLALDDFGTGYSSLSVLHKLPFDTLKIDRAFLEEARKAAEYDQTRRSSVIINAITDLAQHLKLNVIAEGIANMQEVATLQALACRYAQGWHFSKPLPPDRATELLKSPEQMSAQHHPLSLLA